MEKYIENRWDVYETFDNDTRVVHVVPANDLLPHNLTMDCFCHPTVDKYGLVKHLPVDGRKREEEGKDSLRIM